MRLHQVFRALSLPTAIPDVNILDIEILDLACDTRHMKAKSLFVVLPGQPASLIQHAIHAGATAVMTEHVAVFTPHVPVIRVPNLRQHLGLLYHLFYPYTPRCSVAVTGTNGKTSVVNFLHQICQLAGLSSTAVGTLGVVSSFSGKNNSHCVGLTTPPALALYQLFQKEDFFAFEASSHALVQQRLDPMSVDVGVFTSFSQDHLDYHHTLDAYWQAKCLLFQRYVHRWQILFKDLPSCPNPALPTLYYGAASDDFIADALSRATYRILMQKPEGCEVEFCLQGCTWQSFLPLVGAFQMENLLAALCSFVCGGGCLRQIIPQLHRIKPIVGRMDYIAAHQGGRIYVDYAHTPDALAQALSMLRAHTPGRLLIVFGCGGQRDQDKRSLMGKIAQEQSDIVIITDDNPREEDPQRIRQEILSSCPKAQEIFPRETAIYEAMQQLQEGDTLLVAGKGHENTQIIGQETRAFSDHQWILHWARDHLAR